MKVAALMPTYGRFSQLREALAFFLMQDYPDKELVICNDGPESIMCDAPCDRGPKIIEYGPGADPTMGAGTYPTDYKFASGLVRVLNVPTQPTLAAKMELMRDATDADAVSVWADDDWFQPWFFSMTVKHLSGECGEEPCKRPGLLAWKPFRCWFYELGQRKHQLTRGGMEGSMLIRREALLPVAHLGGELIGLVTRLAASRELASTEVGKLSPYVMLWDDGMWHIQGSMNGPKSDEQRRSEFHAHSQDFPCGRTLTPDFEEAKRKLALIPTQESK